MLLARGKQGLWRWEGTWRRVVCPLTHPMLISAGAVADVQHRLAWDGRRVFALPPGVECMLRCPWGYLVLSGEADSLSLVDFAGQLAVVTPAGVYPRGMCLLPDGRHIAVCGGAEGAIRLFSLPDLHLLRRIPVPGCVQQAACAGDTLCVLSLVEEGGLRCKVSLIDLDSGAERVLFTLPGLPGSVCHDGLNGWWVAASECLCRLDGQGRCTFRQEGWGLITHMERKGTEMLLTDSVMGLCGWVDASNTDGAEILFRGDVCHACFRTERNRFR